MLLWRNHPLRTVTTQTNHFFAALCGYIKLELLKCDTRFASITLHSNLNCTCTPFNPLMPNYKNSTLPAWLRKVSYEFWLNDAQTIISRVATTIPINP